MEEHLSQLAPGDGWSTEFDAALHEQQERARTFLGVQRARIDQIEAELARQVDRVALELEQDNRRIEGERDATRQESGELSRGREELARLRSELEASRIAWEQTQQATQQQHQQTANELNRRQGELDARAKELVETEARLRQQQRQLSEERADFESSAEELRLAKSRFEEKTAQLDREREAHQRELADTKGQRRRIAHELRQSKLEIEADGKRQQAEHDARVVELDRRESSLQGREAEIAKRQAEIAELERQLSEAKAAASTSTGSDEQLAQATAECRQAREECTRLEAELSAAGAKLEQSLEAQRESEARSQSLFERLAEADRRLSEASNTAAAGEQLAGLERRHEMLLEDLREQKKTNQKLQTELESLKRGRPVSAPSLDGTDWESQKRRLLASLEAETDDDPSRKLERLSIEETIRKTEAAVAAKEREIDELQRLLEQQSSQVGSFAIGAAAVAAELDKDELIQHEREKLARMQEEWRDKLRQAEIDLSLERAKIARDRAEIEEKLRQTEDERARNPNTGESETASKKPPTRGKWLARLGLKEDEPGAPQ